MVSLVMCRKDFLLHGACLQKTLQILTYFFDWLYLTQCLISFSSIDHPCLCAVFDSISSIIDEALSINPCGNVLSFETFNIHHKDWLTYSGGTDISGDLCCNFSISREFTQMANFPTWILDCNSHSPALLDLFISPEASICSTMVSPPLGNSDHVVVSVFLEFPSYSQQVALFHRIAYEYSHADWNSLCDHLRCSMGGYL